MDNGIYFYNTKGLDLKQSLFCGQCFRWKEMPDGGFLGIVDKYKVTAYEVENGFFLENAKECDRDFWYNYFSLGEDYPSILSKICEDNTLKACVDHASGIRVLHQPFFEILITFIISQNNNIPRITGIVDRLCENFGEFDGEVYAFPTASVLANLTVEDLAPLRAGFRAKYIIDAAKRVNSGEVTLEKLTSLNINDARILLCKILGVGPKVADCVLLFGLGFKESFPRDVWINRAMSQLFPDGLPECAKGVEGIAQQYIFHYARANLEN